MRAFLIALVFLPVTLRAQDERSVTSPNGQLEFRLFVGQPEGALWARVGYQVLFHSKPLIATSWMGLDIRDQEPFLGENPGFMSSDKASSASGHYNSVTAHYMQNGSLGRRLDVEIRAYDDGIAFRYIMPKSTPLEDILVRDEATEFNFADPAALSHLDAKPDYDLPLFLNEPGIGVVVLADAGSASGPVEYPRTFLARTDHGLITSLERSKNEPTLAFAGKTPLTWPWRVVMIMPDKLMPDRDHFKRSGMLSDLNP